MKCPKSHSKCGVYVCKYADVCIRQASVRRTWEGSITIKMIVFKIVEGKQTAALVRKGPKLQPIAPTPQFTSHCSVITPKDTDDLEKQFDQSQIFLYEFDGKDTVKRPHHVLPYAIISLVQDGTQWPTSFDSVDFEPDILETDTLRVIAQTDDQLIKLKMKENSNLAEAATRALERTYDDIVVKPIKTESTSNTPSSNGLIAPNNNNGLTMSVSNDNLSPTSTPSNIALTNTVTSANSTIPLQSAVTTNGLSTTTSTTQLTSTSTTANNITKTSASAVTLPTIALPTAATSAYHRPTSLLGALPTAAAVRPAVYATAANLNTAALGSQIVYGGVPLEALRYQTSPYAFATHAGQAVQQPTLYAQIPAGAPGTSQLTQMATGMAQASVPGIPPGYMLVRTANGGLALLGSQQLQQQQAQTALATQSRLPLTFGAGGLQYGQQQVVYQYAAQPTVQASPTQYIQLPSQYAHQQRLAASPVSTVAVSQSTQQSQHGVTTTPQYPATSQTQYIGTASQPTVGQSSTTSTSVSAANPQAQSQQQSPQQKQTANSQSQQQQLLTYAVQAQQQQPQQQISFLTQSQVQAYAAQQAYQQQLQSAVSLGQQQMYYTGTSSAGGIYQANGQSYVIAQAPTAAGSAGTAMYGYTTIGAQMQQNSATGNGGLTALQAATALQNNAAAYSAALSANALNAASQQQQQTQQPQYAAYQISPYGTAGNQTYQVVDYPGYRMAATQPTAAAYQTTGIVAQQQAQLVQRTNVLPQVRHHPYQINRN
ncbi:unnamed protein product [Didymodactylos carnosus]|uniref:TASOR pseudo-PARP domain-containing protein n=1 Tax=Didymodactylos carnosus TaxID=1234261 RepID=A0A8S2DLV6_9BILA|nr:unnamed protein product [Didymodactylos carnosus]CAF3755632.1 unnamed protein product [Didymodactylos carnosus]